MATSLPKGAVKPRGIQGNKVGGKVVSATGGAKSSAYMPVNKAKAASSGGLIKKPGSKKAC